MTKRQIRTWAIAVALFGTGPASAQVVPPSVDAARLAEARLVTARLLPPGVYRTVMASAMTPMIDTMGTSLKALPLKQLAEMGGLNAKDSAALGKIDVARVMAIYDPHWEERTQLTMRAMIDSMANFFTTLEPELRDAYSHAYASRFTLAELHELNAFFATPTGSKYAAQYMTIATDPAIAGEMRAMMPKMMAQMPTFVAAAQKATAALPPARKMADLSAADRAELAKALGVDPAQLKDPKSAP